MQKMTGLFFRPVFVDNCVNDGAEAGIDNYPNLNAAIASIP
jgi:hypothetical protein